MADENLHAKHRARMQERVERDGLDSLAEHEALEYLLFLSIPRADTNALAHRLIQHFGDFCKGTGGRARGADAGRGRRPQKCAADFYRHGVQPLL